MSLHRWCVVVLTCCLGGAAAIAGNGGPRAAPKPQTVTLDSPCRLNDALKRIEKQTGIAVISQVPGNPELKLDIKDRPFWEAMDDIVGAAGAAIFSLDPIVLKERAQGQPAPLVCHDGLFRMTVKRVSTSVDLTTGAGSCHLLLQVAWEPGGRVFYLDQHTAAYKVLDDSDPAKPLKPVDEGVKSDAVTEKASWDVDLRLPYPPRSARKFARVEGTLLAKGTTRMQQIAFPDLAAGQVGRRDDVILKLRNTVLDGEHWKVQLEMEHPKGGPHFESFQSWVGFDEIGVQSIKNGSKLELTGSNIDVLADDKAVITYLFATPSGKKMKGDPKEWKMTYLTPGRLFEVPIRFSFKDVPLP